MDIIIVPEQYNTTLRNTAFRVLDFCLMNLCTISLLSPLLAVPSGPPTSVSITGLSATSVTFSISQPAPADRNGEILSYAILITESVSGDQVIHTTHDAGGEFTLVSLSPYTMYTSTVAATTVNGTGPYSPTLPFTTHESGKQCCDC